MHTYTKRSLTGGPVHLTGLILSKTETLSGHNPLIIGSKAILLQCLRPYE